MNTLREDEKWIGGRLHRRVAPGHWREYDGEELEERMRQLNDDNPAPMFCETDPIP